jgi:hypothetical protein
MEKKDLKKRQRFRLMIKKILLTIIFLDAGLFLFIPLGRTNADIFSWFGSADFTTFLIILAIIIALYPLTTGKYKFVSSPHKRG